jgi:transcriptional regulator, propionate catabolism operon regulatory protein
MVGRDYAQQADITVIDRTFETALDFVRELEQSRAADVLVCAGATDAYLQRSTTRRA